jgi:hypothetical protein
MPDCYAISFAPNVGREEVGKALNNGDRTSDVAASSLIITKTTVPSTKALVRRRTRLAGLAQE